MSISKDRVAYQQGQSCLSARTELSISNDRVAYQQGYSCVLARTELSITVSARTKLSITVSAWTELSISKGQSRLSARIEVFISNARAELSISKDRVVYQQGQSCLSARIELPISKDTVVY